MKKNKNMDKLDEKIYYIDLTSTGSRNVRAFKFVLQLDMLELKYNLFFPQY